MLYFIVPKKWQWVVILIANVLFYIASGIKYLIYIIFVSFIAYWIALGIEKVNVLSAKTMKAVEDSETKKEVKKWKPLHKAAFYEAQRSLFRFRTAAF